MATRTKNGGKSTVLQKQFKGSLRQRLRPGEKEIIKERREKVELVDIMLKFLDQGFKVGVRYERKENAYRFDAYRAYTGYPDSGYMFTCYHSDVATAACIADFVVFDQWDGKLPAGEATETDW